MPVVLPATMQAQVERLHGDDPFLWLWRLEIQRRTKVLPPVVLLATTWHEPVVWPQSGSSPPDATWYPVPLEAAGIEQGSEGDVPQMDLSVDNTSRFLMRYLHGGQGFEGNSAQAWLLTQSMLAEYPVPDNVPTYKFRIQAASATDSAITFRLADPSMFLLRVPSGRYLPSRCRFKFGSRQCGYVINAAAAYTDCLKTVPDCRLRGDDEIARRLPRLHPKRFGGFPGVPVQR